MGEKGKNFFSLFSFLSFIRNYSEEMAITSEGMGINGEGIYKAGRCGARGSMWGLNVEGNRPSVVVFGGEIFQALFDCCCDVGLHGEFG